MKHRDTKEPTIPHMLVRCLKDLIRLRRRKALLRRLAIALPVLALVSLAARFEDGLFYLLVALPELLIVAASVSAHEEEQREEAAILDSLGDAGAVEAVGPLAELLWQGKDIDRKLILSALEKLLPRLQPADAERMTPDQRWALYTALGLEVHLYPQFLSALLQAIERIRDPAALSQVDGLASRLGWSRASPALLAMSKSCLESLKAEARARQTRGRLLRPADASPDLLRPSDSATSDHEVLLRPEVSHSSSQHD